MSSTTNHYDLIVLGSDVAGLVAAALVARRGKRVLVIPHGNAEGTYRLGPHLLPFSTAPVVHMGTPPARRVFQELGLLQQIRRQHAHLDPYVHLVLPDQRLDIPPGAGHRESELRRQWPTDPVVEAFEHQRSWSRAVDEVLDQLLMSDNALVAEGFWARRFLARVASQLPGAAVDELVPLHADHPVRRAAGAIEPWLQHLDPTQLGKAASLRLRGLWGLGPEDLGRREVRVRELLLQRIALHSGEVKPDLRVGEIVARRGRAVGVTFLGKPDRYGCDHMIVAQDPMRLAEGLAAPDSMPRALLEGLRSVERVGCRYTLHLELDDAGLSPGLQGLVIYLPDAVASIETGARGIGQMYLRRERSIQPGRHRVSIERILAPHEPLEGLRERTLDELDRRGVLPFCRPHVRWMHSPHDGRGATDGEGTPMPALRASPGIATPMESLVRLRTGSPTVGVGLFAHRSGLKSLYLASRMTLPGLGLEGEFLAGSAAAGFVAPPARSPFSRSPLLSRV